MKTTEDKVVDAIKEIAELPKSKNDKTSLIDIASIFLKHMGEDVKGVRMERRVKVPRPEGLQPLVDPFDLSKGRRQG